MQKLTQTTILLCTAFLSLNSQAFTIAKDNLGLTVNGRLQVSGLSFNNDGFQPNLDSVRHSYLALTPWYKVGNAYLGATYVGRYVLDTNNNLVRTENSRWNSSQYYAFIRSPQLGQTSIGKTSGILEDYLLAQENFGISSTNFLPMSNELYHNSMWKYVSSKVRYYDYGFSFTHNAKSDFGSYSQIAGNINWRFQLSDNNLLKIVNLIASQKHVIAQSMRFKSHPHSLGLIYKFADLLSVGVIGYKYHERYTEFTNNRTLKTNQYGMIYALTISPIDKLDLYTRYIYHKIDNKNNSNALTLNGYNVDTNNSIKIRTITYGVQYKPFTYGLIYLDHSRILTNLSNNSLVQAEDLTQFGFGVTF